LDIYKISGGEKSIKNERGGGYFFIVQKSSQAYSWSPKNILALFKNVIVLLCAL
jgi:hypothetical protein